MSKCKAVMDGQKVESLSVKKKPDAGDTKKHPATDTKK